MACASFMTIVHSLFCFSIIGHEEGWPFSELGLQSASPAGSLLGPPLQGHFEVQWKFAAHTWTSQLSTGWTDSIQNCLSLSRTRQGCSSQLFLLSGWRDIPVEAIRCLECTSSHMKPLESFEQWQGSSISQGIEERISWLLEVNTAFLVKGEFNCGSKRIAGTSLRLLAEREI